MLDFNGQIVIVTGSGSPKGIGRTIAQTFAKQGATVVLTDINQEGVEANAKEIEAMGGKAYGVAGNICDKASVDALVADVLAKFGRIDVLVNNAGISQKVTVADMTMADIQRIFNVNMFGLFQITQAVCEVMKKQRYGRIVHLSSVSGKRGGGVFGGAHYSASKAGLLHLTRSFAAEWAPHNIRVNSISPGYIATPMSVDPNFVEPELLEAWKPLMPMHRMAKPEELTGAVIWLCSDSAAYANGTDLLIDGLYTAV